MNAIIVDNEFMPAEHLEALVNRHCPEIKEQAVFLNPKDALIHLKKHTVDVVFLDVEMPEMNAFEFIEIAGREALPPVIFTTAHSKYAVQAFQVEALDYLLKPVDPDLLVEAVKKVKVKTTEGLEAKFSNARKALNQELNRIALASGEEYHVVDKSEVIRIEADGSYSTFFLKDGRKITTSRRLNYYSDQFLSENFFKPHQSHLVNLSCVERYSKSD